eukprot:9039799-Alexandrium_andersonii.AAC.1
MSASLVGSEMCIRDSSTRAHRLDGSSWGFSKPEDRDLGTRLIGAHRPHSVSYTHLTLPTICSV